MTSNIPVAMRPTAPTRPPQWHKRPENHHPPRLDIPSHRNGGRGGGVHRRPPHGVGLLDGNWITN